MTMFSNGLVSPMCVLVLLAGGAVAKGWSQPDANFEKPMSGPTGATTDPAILGRPARANDGACQPQFSRWFEPGKLAQAGELISNVRAVLAIADATDEKAVKKVADAMTPGQCWWVFQRLLELSPARSLSYPWAVDAVLESLLPRCVKGQREATARWLVERENQFPDIQEVQECAAAAIIAWGQADARAAANFALTIAPDADDTFSLSRVLGKVCSNWGRDNPVDALAWAKALPNADTHKVYALEGIVSPFNAWESAEAKTCVEQMVGVNKDAPELAAYVAGRLAQEQVSEQNAPSAAARWAQSLSGLPERREALKSIIGAWVPYSAKSLLQVVQWATALPPSETRGTVWGTVAINWSMFDAAKEGLSGGSPEFFASINRAGKAANKWLSGLPKGIDREEAIAIRDQWEVSLKKQMIWR